MSVVLGIDYSSKAVDLVYLDESSDAARWHTIPLERGVAGIRGIRNAYAWARELENVYLLAIEDPFSAGRTAAKKLGRMCGAILASLPPSLEDDAVWILRPDEWRMACGLKGNATKAEVAAWARERFGDLTGLGLWPQDAVDALCIAYAARGINQDAVVARSAA